MVLPADRRRVAGVVPLTTRRNARLLRRFHGAATVGWALLVIPTIIFWRNSILWISLMSVYAVVISHFAAWQASRAEDAANGDTTD